MERVNITIGPLSFDHADYDAENDVLYPEARLRQRPRRAASGDNLPFERPLSRAGGLGGSDRRWDANRCRSRASARGDDSTRPYAISALFVAPES